jgi:A/G-specific adenine glycosylase
MEARSLVATQPAEARRSPLSLSKAEPIEFSVADFRFALSAWYRAHARKLPWRNVRDPYAIWLSEIMLQQTRVATVIDRYSEFLRRFPTLRALADADEDEVLALWSGLGYYRRARMLHRAAQFVLREWRGKLPRTAAELRTLPGVGDYTSAAIASIAFGQRVAVLDGNVERVLLRLLGRSEEKSDRGRARLLATAQELLPPVGKKSARNGPGDHNQAMMELGATVCLPVGPLCSQCPVVTFCRTRSEHPKPSREKQHSRIAAYLLALRKRGVVTEVLLERRGTQTSQMPGMMELPPLPLAAIAGREPVLRLRHAITNTNYYVQVFAESARGVEPELDEAQDLEFALTPKNASPELTAVMEDVGDDRLFVADPSELTQEATLLSSLPAVGREWVAAGRLMHLPLTGLARKSLQRLGVMAVPKVQIG